MTLKALSPTIQTLLSDLAQKVSTAPQAGSVYERTVDGIVYLYAKIAVATTRVDTFIGRKDDPAARARAEMLRQGMALAKERRSLVAMLKRSGIAGPIRAFGETLDAVAHFGLFGGGAVLGLGFGLVAAVLAPSPPQRT